MIIVPNRELSDDHQQELSKKCNLEGWALICEDIKDLLGIYEESESFMPYPSVWYQWKKRDKPTTIDKY